MTEPVAAVQTEEEVLAQYDTHLAELLAGGRDYEADDIATAEPHGEELVALVRGGYADVRKRIAANATKPKLAIIKPASPKTEPLKLRLWSEVHIPEGANDLERLTFVPGLTGDITNWIVQGARRPNRMIALGVAVVVVGTIIGRLIEGPTRSGTHLYIINLAPTGYGKDWPLQCGSTLMTAAGFTQLVGPDEFASSPGFWNRLKRNPHLVCFVDELGNELKLINDQSGNGFVYKIIGTLKKCYNAWATVRTAETVGKESATIIWPAPSIVGAGTPESFFASLRPEDLESGFANRLLILPFEGHRRPSERAPSGEDEPPKSLVTDLGRLPQQKSNGEAILDNGKLLPRKSIGWGEGAEEIYLAFSRKMDELETSDRQKYELGMRVCENAVRLATNIAVGRGSPTVDREDISWAIALAERSFTAAVGGVQKYMRQYFEFPQFCDRVFEFIRASDETAKGAPFRSTYILKREFRSSQKLGGFQLDNVLDQLVDERRIVACSRPAARGPSSAGYAIEEESL